MADLVTSPLRGNNWTGYDAQTQQLPRFTPEQQDLINSLIPQIQQGLQQRSDFAPFEQKARRDFNTKTIPSIAERFTAMGGGQRSSAFQDALGQAGSDLETNLAAMGSGHQLQQQQLLQNLLGHSLSPSFENIYIPQSSGLAGRFAGDVSSGLGASLPAIFSSLLEWLLPSPVSKAFKSLSSLLGGQQQQPQQNRPMFPSGAQQGYNRIQG